MLASGSTPLRLERAVHARAVAASFAHGCRTAALTGIADRWRCHSHDNARQRRSFVRSLPVSLLEQANPNAAVPETSTAADLTRSLDDGGGALVAEHVAFARFTERRQNLAVAAERRGLAGLGAHARAVGRGSSDVGIALVALLVAVLHAVTAVTGER